MFMLLYILVFWTKPKSISNSTKFSEGGQRLTWIQRLSAAIGVVKGIQFLHGGIMPGLFSNDLKVTNIFLDQNLVAKISSYNLPVLAENMITMVKIKILHPSRLCWLINLIFILSAFIGICRRFIEWIKWTWWKVCRTSSIILNA